MAVAQIPITKAGRGVTLTVDLNDFNDASFPTDVYQEIFEAGLEVFLNKRMSKLAAPSKLEGQAAEEAKAKALDAAAKNLDDLKAGKLRKRGAKAKSDVPQAVITEARRLARIDAKDAARAAGVKPLSLVPASMWTKAADALIAQDPAYLEKARANLAARETKPVTVVDIKSLISIDPAKLAKAEQDREAAKAHVSAAAAAKAAPRRRPTGATPAH